MGSTLSRPLQSLESGLLSAASALDSILARAERGVTSLFSRALGPLFGFDTSRRIARACDDDGFCYVPATHAARAKEQRLARGYTRSRIARRAKRAEAAARGQVGEALDRVASRANEEKERLVRVTSRANDEKDRLIKIVEADRVKVVAAVEGVLHDNEKKLHAAEAKLRAAIDVEKQKVGKARQSLDAQRTAVTEAVLNVKGALHLTPAEPPSPDASPLKAVDPAALINSVWNYGASFWQVSPSPSNTQLPPAQAELVAKSLGEPARAPAPRSERERETAAERAKGQLWVMGNVAPAKAAVAPPPPPPHVEAAATPSPRGRQRTKGLDSVREVVSMYGSPPRPAAAAVPAEAAEEVKLLHGHGRRKNGSEHDVITYQVVATSAAAEATTPSPKLKLRKSSKPTAAKEEPMAKASPALVAPTPRRAAQAHVLHAEPTLVAPTAQRAAAPARINTALAHSPPTRVSSPPLSRSAGAQQRTSFEAQRTPGGGGGRASPAPSFDAVSIAASWGRSATPPVVAELADKACQSRKRERKAWKDEVNRMALERCQANSARARASTPSSPVVASARPASPGLGLVRKLSNGPALVRVKSARASNNSAASASSAVQTQRLNATLGAARARRVSAPLAARAV